jgi:hypothetical protein
MLYGRGPAAAHRQRRARRPDRRRAQPPAGAPAPAPKRTSPPCDRRPSSLGLLPQPGRDRPPGVLAAVAKVFGDHDVSIRAMEQVGLAERPSHLPHPRGARGGPAGHHRRAAPALTGGGPGRWRAAGHRGGGVRERVGSGYRAGAGSWRSTATSFPSVRDTPVVTLLEGGTPLVPAPRLSARVGAGCGSRSKGPTRPVRSRTGA